MKPQPKYTMSDLENISEMPESDQIELVKLNKLALQYLPNPSPVVQLAAVRVDGVSLGLIKHPAPGIELEAVKQDGLAISFIREPSPLMQALAIKQNPYALKYISYPSPKALEACKSHIIKYILVQIHDGLIISWKNDLCKAVENMPWPELKIIKKSLDANANK